MIFLYIITVAILAALLVMSELRYRALKLEWEEMNSEMDVITSNYNKAKKEISDLQDQNDDLAVKHSEEIQKLIVKYEKKLTDAKEKVKAMKAELDGAVINENNCMASLEEAAVREANYLNTIAELEKVISDSAAKKERAKARAKKKKEKEEESKEQLEIAFDKLEEVEIAPGEGEAKCEKKKRGRKKGDSK